MEEEMDSFIPLKKDVVEKDGCFDIIDILYFQRERCAIIPIHLVQTMNEMVRERIESAHPLFLGAHQLGQPTVDEGGGRLKCLSGPGWKRAGVYKRRFVSAVSRRQITESRRRDAVEFAAFGAQASGNRRGHRLEKDGIAVVPRRSQPTRLPAHPSIHLLLAISTGLSTLYHPTFYVYS